MKPHFFNGCFLFDVETSIKQSSGAAFENIDNGGANSLNYQTETGGANLVVCLALYGAPPLNPRLTIGNNHLQMRPNYHVF